MSDEELCGAPLKTKDGKCDRTATKEDGRCGYHTEIEEEQNMDRNWKPAMTHGLNQSRGGYYKSQSDEDKAFIDAIAQDLISKSNFTEEDDFAVEKLRQVAVDIHQKRTADEYVAKKGLTQEKSIGFHEQYGEITQEEENVLMITKDRLSRESRMTIKDFGILEQDDSSSDEAAKSLIEDLSG
jgi:hypothetical protein